VIRKPASHLFSSPASRARLLAVVLLAALAWGSTAEFTHHHGARLRAIACSPVADQPPAGQIESGDANGPSSNSKKGAECLICQLHQNLSTTEIGHTPGVTPSETRRPNTPTREVFELPAFTSRGHGRAPPSIV
jgi:hypothetical protein